METFSALLDLCAGNSPVTGEFPTQMPLTRSFDVFSDLHLNKRLSKHSWGWWFETPSRPLWHHCNELHSMTAHASACSNESGSFVLLITRQFRNPCCIGKNHFEKSPRQNIDFGQNRQHIFLIHSLVLCYLTRTLKLIDHKWELYWNASKHSAVTLLHLGC